MPTNSSPSLKQLREAIEIHEKIQKLEAELVSILGGGGEIPTPFNEKPAETGKARGRKKGSKFSAAARAKMAAAAKARWAAKKGK